MVPGHKSITECFRATEIQRNVQSSGVNDPLELLIPVLGLEMFSEQNSGWMSVFLPSFPNGS